MRPALPEGPWLVVGIARSGIASGRLLAARGEEVLGVDTGTELAADPGFPVELGTDGLAALDRGVGAVVKSPGVPPSAPAVAAARERGIPVLGELELGWRLVTGTTFVAITGTNGKTTTTEWLTHVVRRAGRSVRAAGNVGTALTSLVDDPPDVVVCECSSYQLHDTLAFRPEVGVLLNLGSDHVNWHGSVEAYRAAKLTGMFSRQTRDDVAIAPPELTLPGAARWLALEPDARAGLPGAHNQLNAGAVAAAARALGVDEEQIAAGLQSFTGVEHRLQLLATLGGVAWVNDSKATNVAAALTAIEATPPPVHLILGGDDAKQEGFTPLRGRAHATYLIGEAAERLAREVGGERCGDLETAVARAGAAARPGDTVLLSPACASFDQYRSYEDRGRHFAALVEARA